MTSNQVQSFSAEKTIHKSNISGRFWNYTSGKSEILRSWERVQWKSQLRLEMRVSIYVHTIMKSSR